jgi:hypothetical protein
MSTIDLNGILRPIRAVGSMEAGGNLLRLSKVADFRVGDQVIVEIGGEAGKGLVETEGVGGIWPGNPDDGRYYNRTNLPRSLVSEVAEVSGDGRTLTLDLPAVVATTNAHVHLDNTKRWEAATFWNEDKPVTTEENVEVIIPAGSFAVQGLIPNTWHKGWTITGAGKNATEFYSPDGVPTVYFRAFECPRTTLSGLRLRGNVGVHGFGPPDWYPGAIDFTLSADSVIRDVICIDCWRALSINYSGNTWAYNVDAYLTEQLMCYVSWQHAWANSENGGAVDCGVYSRFLTAAIEAFQSSGTQFIRPVLLNGMASSNSSAGMLVEDLYLHTSAGQRIGHIDANTIYNPLVNFNRNVDNQQGVPEGISAKGGRIVRPRLIQDGAIDNGNGAWLLSGIVSDTNNVVVEGGYYLVPDMESANDTKGRGTPGFNTDSGVNCIVDGFTSWGRADEGGWHYLIHNPQGTVRNSKALLIKAAVEENNTYDPGPRPDIEPFPEGLLTPPPMALEPLPEEPPPEEEPLVVLLRSILDHIKMIEVSLVSIKEIIGSKGVT